MSIDKPDTLEAYLNFLYDLILVYFIAPDKPVSYIL